MAIDWTEERMERLKELFFLGCNVPEIANTLTLELNERVSVKSVEQAKYRGRLNLHTMAEAFDVPIYKAETIAIGDYMISCDYHSPYHNIKYVNRLLAVADRFKIKRNIIIGDLFDMDFAKHWYAAVRKQLDDEIKEVSPVIQALDYFDENILICGNHETRVGRITDGRVQAKHLYRLFGKEVWDKKFRYSEYDKMWIGNKWLLVHPISYSQISTSVAKRLAEKFHRNIINTHGHLVSMARDRSGEYLVVDLGGMFDSRKIEYINKHTSTHPVWANGFAMLRNGYLHHFTDATDWDFWLGNGGKNGKISRH